MTSLEDVVTNYHVVAAGIAATASAVSGIAIWFFRRVEVRTELQAKNFAAQLEGWKSLTERLQGRIQFLEERDRTADAQMADLRERILACEKDRISLTRENVRYAERLRRNIE